MPSAAEAAAADALQRMRYFAHFSDADGLIMAAGELEKAAPNLLYHDVLLKETAPAPVRAPRVNSGRVSKQASITTHS